jgi:hypothetical protein
MRSIRIEHSLIVLIAASVITGFLIALLVVGLI